MDIPHGIYDEYKYAVLKGKFDGTYEEYIEQVYNRDYDERRDRYYEEQQRRQAESVVPSRMPELGDKLGITLKFPRTKQDMIDMRERGDYIRRPLPRKEPKEKPLPYLRIQKRDLDYLRKEPRELPKTPKPRSTFGELEPERMRRVPKVKKPRQQTKPRMTKPSRQRATPATKKTPPRRR